MKIKKEISIVVLLNSKRIPIKRINKIIAQTTVLIEKLHNPPKIQMNNELQQEMDSVEDEIVDLEFDLEDQQARLDQLTRNSTY